jgi:hypothetical protein
MDAACAMSMSVGMLLDAAGGVEDAVEDGIKRAPGVAILPKLGSIAKSYR